MLNAFSRKVKEMNRRRHIARIRRAFAHCGHPVDDLDDSKVVAAVTNGDRKIADAALTSQSIYFALRRLSKDREQHSRKCTLSVEASNLDLTRN
ncbi:MAG: hypothetical protein ABJA02_15510 [Acidobacteriota bacterium]